MNSSKRSNPTFDDVFENVEIKVKRVALALKAIIIDVHPSVVETAQPGWRVVNYGFYARKMSGTYAYLAPHKNRVNLGFHKGSSLKDPHKLLEGTGKNMRHVKVTNFEKNLRSEVRQLIIGAMNERGKVLGEL